MERPTGEPTRILTFASTAVSRSQLRHLSGAILHQDEQETRLMMANSMDHCQTRVLKHLLSQACVGIILRSPPISCRQGRYTRETCCALDSRTSLLHPCE